MPKRQREASSCQAFRHPGTRRVPEVEVRQRGGLSTYAHITQAPVFLTVVYTCRFEGFAEVPGNCDASISFGKHFAFAGFQSSKVVPELVGEVPACPGAPHSRR